MRSLNGWTILCAALGGACGSGAAPADDSTHPVAGHAGVSGLTAGSSAGGASSGGAASGGAASGGTAGRNGAGTGGVVGAAGGGSAASGNAGASGSGPGSAGATLGGGGAGGATAAGAAGMNAGATAGGSPNVGGQGGAAGAPLGGAAGGAPLGGAAGAGGAGGDAGTPFTCNQLTGGQLVEEWFIAGFEDVVDDPRWQVKWRVDGYLEEWANPQSSFWTAPVDSACAKDTGSPDRLVFPVVSFTSRARADWVKTIEQALTTFQGKYPRIRRVDLMTQVRGPNNMLCPTAPTQGETIVVAPELDAAIDDVAAAHPGFVFVGPRVEARSCSDILNGGPHLTTAGNTAAAVPISSYFVAAQ